MGSITRDNARVHSVHDALFYQHEEHNTFDANKQTPVPIDISYNVDVIVRYHTDLDEILSNFIPFMNPDVFVVWPHPKRPNLYIKSQIVWNGGINITFAGDISPNQYWKITASTGLTFKTWIFPGMGADDDSGPIIKRINFSPNIIPLGDDGYMLDRWYDVPTGASMDTYRDNIINGLIKKDRDRTNWDWLPISGEVSGYWQTISAVISGSTQHLDQISAGNFLQTEDGDLLIYTHKDPQWTAATSAELSGFNYWLTPGMSEVDYWNYYLETISGDLSGGVWEDGVS